MLPYGALRFTYRNFLTVPPGLSSVTEHHQPVGLDAGLDQLPKARDAEARREVVGVLAVALRFALVHQPAALRRRDAHHEVELVLGGKLAPALDDVAVVLRRHGEPGAVVDAVVIEEHTVDLVALRERRPGELV